MSNFVALFDSCVLYPAPLRDLLMHLAITGLFRAKWTNHIHEEWISSLLVNRTDLTREKLERTRDLMNQGAGDCLVEGYEELIDSLSLPDENDRHILAAAIKCSAAVIVTFNLKDFPAGILMKYEIDVQDPDTFISHLLDLNAGMVCKAVKRQRSFLHNPSRSVRELLETFESLSLTQTVSVLRDFEDLL